MGRFQGGGTRTVSPVKSRSGWPGTGRRSRLAARSRTQYLAMASSVGAGRHGSASLAAAMLQKLSPGLTV